jgi:uncharacterized protein (TIGR03083 family)
VNKRDILRQTKAERARTLSLLSPLVAEAFDTPTALPGWRIREVVAHLIAIDRATVTGSILVAVLASTDKLERWNDAHVGKWADRPPRDLLLGLDRWGRRYATYVRIIPGPLFGLRIPTMYGRGPAGLLIWARPFDEWVHRQDIRRALGLPDEDVDLENVAEFVLECMVTNALPKLEGETGRVTVALERVSLPEWGYDLRARAGGPELSREAQAVVHVPAGAFVMAAAGRDRFEDLEEQGTLKLQGDEDLARRFLARVRIV